MNFFFKYKTYTSFEPHLLYKQEMLQWMRNFFFPRFLVVLVKHRSCKQSAFYFSPLILNKKEKNSLTGQLKTNSSVGLNIAKGLRHRNVRVMTSRVIRLWVCVHVFKHEPVCCSTAWSLITSQLHHQAFANIPAKSWQRTTLKEQLVFWNHYVAT